MHRPCPYSFYSNYGTIPATDAYKDFQLVEYLSITSAIVPFTDLGGDLYRFDLGTVAPAESGWISIQAALSCEDTLGATYCLEAEIFPHEPCCEMLLNWSGASVEVVDAICESDELTFVVGIMTKEMEASFGCDDPWELR